MTAPEPWLDAPLDLPPRQRRSQDPHLLARDQRHTDTEFGFGAGLVAPHLNGWPPSEDGVYMPRCPRVDPPPRGIGQPQQHRRPRGEARGYPGDQVAG